MNGNQLQNDISHSKTLVWQCCQISKVYSHKFPSFCTENTLKSLVIAIYFKSDFYVTVTDVLNMTLSSEWSSSHRQYDTHIPGDCILKYVIVHKPALFENVLLIKEAL